MTAESPTLVALLHGPDAPGIVARVSGWIFANGGNILHADQHRDQEEGVFFQRIEWAPNSRDLDGEAAAFRHFAGSNGMTAHIAASMHKPRVVIMVSKASHCFHDLALRWKAGEYPGEVAAGQWEFQVAAEGYGFPFHLTAFQDRTKPEVEREQVAIIRKTGAELVIMARYMQVLSEDFLQTVGMPVINIHHSFLPAFAG